MSDKDFNKKIRKKLLEHRPAYDAKAWEALKPALPLPWYHTFLSTYGGWLFGGLMSSVLLFTFFYQKNQNEKLYDEISTLKNELSTTKMDTVLLTETRIDTVYINDVVIKYIHTPRVATVEGQSSTFRTAEKREGVGTPKGREANSALTTNSAESDAQAITRVDKSIAANDRDIANAISKQEIDNADDSVSQEEQNATSTLITNSEEIVQKELDDKAKSIGTSEDENIIQEETVYEPTGIEEPEKGLNENEVDDKPIVTQKGKKITLPKMRVGLTTDYLGLKVLANGLNTEFFITDKLTLNTSVLFSGKITSRHKKPRDFNQITGRNFREEFERFNPRIPDDINDISITTSFVRVPVHLNYYISTWSRFKFLISAGTKLDVSVFQDVDFNSNLNNDIIRNRFEARPKPRVFNNLNYGMGLEYQYRGFIGQLVPYFDFNFRRTDYFAPPRNFGIAASLKYQLGK